MMIGVREQLRVADRALDPVPRLQIKPFARRGRVRRGWELRREVQDRHERNVGVQLGSGGEAAVMTVIAVD
jgi:hypothetical protein